jgi:transcription initiation factor TFIID subunit TAF12
VQRRRFDEERQRAAQQAQQAQQQQQFQMQQQQQQQQQQFQMQQPLNDAMMQHKAAHELAMRMFNNPMSVHPFPVSFCPPGTARSSSSTSSRVFRDADGTLVSVTERSSVCDGVRKMMRETVRQRPDGTTTREVQEE